MDSNSKTSAQLERELEAQRTQIEGRIGEIRDRLSPGQLIDEALAYTGTGGKEFAENLGKSVTNNPLPVALIGIGLAWLVSGQSQKLAAPAPRPAYRPEPDYPYATINGTMRRVSHAADEAGNWLSEFEDAAGKRYKAAASDVGHRAGHFVDDTGRKIGGFIDEAGHRVKDFRDEAGNRFDDAAGWASHTWRDVQHGVSDTVDHLAHQAHKLGDQAQHQADKTSRMIVDMFKQQPLVAGALAFAAGAALGAVLPATEQEDQALGKLSDKTKAKAGALAAEVYEDGKEKAGELYEKGKDGVAKVYDDASSKVEDATRSNPLH